MAAIRADIGIIGGGFSGGLAAILLARVGLRAVLLEPSIHPRFRIGESSTPTANLLLRMLSEHYEIPELMPLTRFGTWRETYPDLLCGLKRGFSYFKHEKDSNFRTTPQHDNELLVAASSRDEVADTHWLRADVDQFFFRLAEEHAYEVRQGVRVEELRRSQGGWSLSAKSAGSELTSEVFEFPFLIDASGQKQLAAGPLGLKNTADKMKTHSRAIYSHFVGVHPWSRVLQSLSISDADHPFDSDNAAQHHLIDEGWLWALRFHGDLASVGVVLDSSREVGGGNGAKGDAGEQWESVMKQYPSLARMLSGARIASDPGRMIATSRLQRRLNQASGDNWALLPFTAGFVDPLHSTGIAHTVLGVSRIVAVLREHFGRPSLSAAMRRCGGSLLREIDQVDRIVAGCYVATGDFQRFVDFSMIYFIAAHRFENRLLDETLNSSERLAGPIDFLCANDTDFCDLVEEASRRVADPSVSTDRFGEWLFQSAGKFNPTGLGDAAKHNMYHDIVVE